MYKLEKARVDMSPKEMTISIYMLGSVTASRIGDQLDG